MKTQDQIHADILGRIIDSLEFRVVELENQGYLEPEDDIELSAIDQLLNQLSVL